MKLSKSTVPLTAVLALTFTRAVASPLSEEFPTGESSTSEISFEEAFGFTPDVIIEAELGEEFDLGMAVLPEQASAQARGLNSLFGKIYVHCSGSYDYPHESASSACQAINAHLTVKCKGTPGYADITTVRAQSRMTDQIRLGAVSTRTGKSGYAFTGGELSCLTTARGYQALGVAAITWPAGFSPQYGSFGIKSTTRSFFHNGGRCVLY